MATNVSDGQIIDAHSISAGLDYPGIGPEHSWLHDIGRIKYLSTTDEESLEALSSLIKWAESKGKTSIQYHDYDEFFGVNKNNLFLSEIVGSKDGIEWVLSLIHI